MILQIFCNIIIKISYLKLRTCIVIVTSREYATAPYGRRYAATNVVSKMFLLIHSSFSFRRLHVYSSDISNKKFKVTKNEQ